MKQVLKLAVLAMAVAALALGFTACNQDKPAGNLSGEGATAAASGSGAAAADNPNELTWSASTVNDALALAKQQNKRVMVDFYADWCGWCTKLDKEVYTNAELIKLSKDWVCAKVNSDNNRSDAQRYGVTGLPTIVFFSADGREINRFVGYRQAPEFVKVLGSK